MRRYLKELFKSKPAAAVIIGAIIAGLSTALVVTVQSCDNHSALKTDNTQLRTENAQLQAKVRDLETDLIPFKTMALTEYKSMDRTALAALATNLLAMKSELLAVKNIIGTLDDRTAFIRDLPDGRKLLGDFVSGEPSVLTALVKQAIEAYNRQDYATAGKLAHEYIGRYEESETQTQNKIRLSDSSWPRMAGAMYSILAEEAMSKWRYDEALKLIARAIELDPRPFNDEIKAGIYALKGEQKKAEQIAATYRTQPQDKRDPFFRDIIKMGYLRPTKTDKEGYDLLAKNVGMTVPVERPLILRMTYQNQTRTYLQVWSGMGTYKPFNIPNNAIEQ